MLLRGKGLMLSLKMFKKSPLFSTDLSKISSLAGGLKVYDTFTKKHIANFLKREKKTEPEMFVKACIVVL